VADSRAAGRGRTAVRLWDRRAQPPSRTRERIPTSFVPSPRPTTPWPDLYPSPSKRLEPRLGAHVEPFRESSRRLKPRCNPSSGVGHYGAADVVRNLCTPSRRPAKAGRGRPTCGRRHGRRPRSAELGRRRDAYVTRRSVDRRGTSSIAKGPIPGERRERAFAAVRKPRRFAVRLTGRLTVTYPP
jgi:hypothetical protein